MRRIQPLGLLFSLCAIAGCTVGGSTPAPGSRQTGPAPAGGGPGSNAAPGNTPAPGNGSGSGSATSADAGSAGGSLPTPPAGKAMIRVVHASPDAPNVDVYAAGNSTPIVTGLGYGQTSAWIEVDSGTVGVELRASPSTATSPLVYATGPLTIADQADITAVAAGLAASANADDSLRVIPLINSFAATAPMTARVRVLHAGADAPTVDLDVGNQNPTAPAVTGLARFADTGASGVALPSGQALALGIDVAGARVTAFTTPELADGADILVVATGLLGSLARQSSGFSLLIVGPNGNLGFVQQDPLVYALHASPDAPEVDAFVGENKLIDGLSFGQLTAPMQVQPGTYQVDLFPHADGPTRPAGAPVLSQPVGSLAAGQRYLAVATGFLTPPAGAQPLQLGAIQENFTLGDTGARLRAIHESPDAPAVDIGIVALNSIAPVLFGGLAFGASSPDTGLAATPGQLPVGVAPAGMDNTIVSRFTIPATSGQRAFVIAEGALSPPPGDQAFRLGVIDTVTSPWTVKHVFPQ
jgi:hypothetical protein